MEDITYLNAASDAIYADHDDIKAYLTTRCPECDREAFTDPDAHVLVNGYVVIGCEGYYVIDPNLVGIESPNWSSWLDDNL